jgi:hypothetical protein
MVFDHRQTPGVLVAQAAGVRESAALRVLAALSPIATAQAELASDAAMPRRNHRNIKNAPVVAVARRDRHNGKGAPVVLARRDRHNSKSPSCCPSCRHMPTSWRACRHLPTPQSAETR